MADWPDNTEKKCGMERCVIVCVKLIEHEPAWVILIGPEIIAQVTWLGPARREHTVKQGEQPIGGINPIDALRQE